MCGPSLSLAGREAERSWTGWVNTCIGRDYLLLPANICSPEPIQQMPVRHSALRMQSHALWQLHKSCSDQRLQDPFMASSHGLGPAGAQDHKPKAHLHTGVEQEGVMLETTLATWGLPQGWAGQDLETFHQP